MKDEIKEYDRWLNGTEVKAQLKNAKKDDKFCVYCYKELARTKEVLYYCPNEMCLNDDMGKITERKSKVIRLR